MKHVSSDVLPERQPKLLDQLRRTVRDKHYILSTERTYVYWARWYIRFHRLRHPKDIRIMQEPPKHTDVSTAMTDVHVVIKSGRMLLRRFLCNQRHRT